MGMPVPDAYDVAAVRAQFPALAEGFAHFDGPGGTQVPEAVSDAVHETFRSAVSNRHGPFASSRRADAIVDAARGACAELVDGRPEGVFFGASMTANTYLLAGALAKTWVPGDEVVVSRLDHDANVRPWVQAAQRAGAVLRWAEVSPVTGELDLAQYEELIGARTRLIAVTAASNATGSRPDVRAAADRAHAVGALVHVDGVHATPHGPVSMAALGADFYACSAYKWYGPHVGVTVADPVVLAGLSPDKLLPSSDAIPDRFELGTPAFAQLAGVEAAARWLMALGPPAVQAHEEQVFARLLEGLTARPDVTLVGQPERRTPTVAFLVSGRSPAQVSADLAAQGVAVWAGDYYAVELMRSLGLAASGGAVRAGVVGYTTVEEVDRLLAAL